IRGPAHEGAGACCQSSRSGCNSNGRGRLANSTALPECCDPLEGIRIRPGSGHPDSSGEAWRRQRSARCRLALDVVGGANGAAENSEFPMNYGLTFGGRVFACSRDADDGCRGAGRQYACGEKKKSPADRFTSGRAFHGIELAGSALAGGFSHAGGPLGLPALHLLGCDVFYVRSHAPGMAERVIELSIAIPPEHVCKRHGYFAVRRDGAIENGVHILRVEEQIDRIDGGTTWGGGHARD